MPRADRLCPIDHLEQGRESEEGHGVGDHGGVLRIGGVEEDAGEAARECHHQEGDQGHEPDAERIRRPAGAAYAFGIAGAISQPNPHRRGLREPERHHEGERSDLQRDGVRGERLRPEQPHHEGGGVEQPDLEQERAADRQADAPDRAETPPIGPPEPPEKAVAPELAVDEDHDGEPAEDEQARDRGRDPGAGEPERWEAKASEHEGPGDSDIERQRQEAHEKDPARPLERGEEGAQHDGAEEGQEGPLQRPHIGRGLRRERRLLSEHEKDGLGVPEHEPDRD